MYCIECGSENLDRAKFCMECGAKMPAPGQKPAEPQAPAAPEVAAEKAEEAPTPPEEAQQEEAREEEAAPDEESKEEVKEEAPPESQIPTLLFAKEEVPIVEEAGEGQGEGEEEEEKEEEQPGEALTMLPAAIPMGIAVAAAPEAAPDPEPKAEEPAAETESKEEEKAEEAETIQPTLPQVPVPAAAAPSIPPAWPPERPKSMKTLGILCIISGALSALINIVAPIIAVGTLWNNRGAEIALVAIPTVAAVWLGYSVLLLVGGAGLVRGRLWGRKLCLAFAWTGVLLMVYSGIGLKVVEGVMAARGIQQSFSVLVAAGLFFPALTVVLLMALSTGRIKRWAEFMEAGPGVVPPAEPEPSMPAVFCLLTSLLPIPVFAHLYSVILGFVGLRQIRRSGGRKCGRGKAIAGLVISGLALVAVLAGIGLAIGIAAAKNR